MVTEVAVELSVKMPFVAPTPPLAATVNEIEGALITPCEAPLESIPPPEINETAGDEAEVDVIAAVPPPRLMPAAPLFWTNTVPAPELIPAPIVFAALAPEVTVRTVPATFSLTTTAPPVVPMPLTLLIEPVPPEASSVTCPPLVVIADPFKSMPAGAVIDTGALAKPRFTFAPPRLMVTEVLELMLNPAVPVAVMLPSFVLRVVAPALLVNKGEVAAPATIVPLALVLLSAIVPAVIWDAIVRLPVVA